MASATLDSKAAFEQRACQVGVEEAFLTALKAAGFDTFGSLAFAVPHSQTRQDEEVFVAFLKRVNGGADPTQIQVACMRRLFYESHTLALSDLKQRVESGPDPAQQTRRLPTAERVARQNEQETRLAGIVFSPEVMPSHRLVDQFVEMAESGILAYISPDNCTSRAQEVQCVKKDAAISLDSAGVLKLTKKHQIVGCDKQLFTLASLQTMGTLSAPPAGQKPLDGVIDKLSQSNEVLQYLMPLPQTRSTGSRDTGEPPAKKQRVSPKGGQKGTKDGGKGKYSLPDGCVAKDDQNRPLCFAFQSGKCSYKGPKPRCARGP